MIVDFRRKPPALPPLTIMNSTVTSVESFRFLGTTISQDLKWDIQIDSTVKKAQQRLYFLRQLRKFNLPQELLKQFYSAIIESVLCTSLTVWFSSATKSDHRRLRRVFRTAERIIGTTLPTLKNCTHPEWAKGLVKSLWTTLTSSTLPLWTVTVWSMLQSSEHQNDQTQEQFLPSGNPSHEHLTINAEHTTLLYIIYSPHLFLFFFIQICTYQTCTHIIVYILYCVFAVLYIAYLYIILLLSVSCPVAVFLLHCGASVTITNSSYVETYLANKAHSDSDSDFNLIYIYFFFSENKN